MRRLTVPAPLRGSNGIAFGPDSRLYVAEFLAGRISAVDIATAISAGVALLGVIAALLLKPITLRTSLDVLTTDVGNAAEVMTWVRTSG